MVDERAPGARRMRPLLGTFVEIGIQDVTAPERAFQQAFAVIEDIGRLLSFQSPDSDVTRLNCSAGGYVEVRPVTARVLRLARALGLASGGLFNCTVGGRLVRLGVLPDHGGRPVLDAGSPADVEIEACRVRLGRPLRVTLDGIAKGYAVDLAIRELQRHGVRSGWVNAGGDLRAFGAMTLPVHRRQSDGSLCQLGGLRSAALATSAVSPAAQARFPARIVSGSDRKAPSGVWTVLANRAWKADALTKVAALAPPHQCAHLLHRLGGRLIGPA